MEPEVVYLGLGSNLGDKVAQCLLALKEVSADNHNQIKAVSSLYKTEPIGYRDQDWFINCVAEVSTTLPPHPLQEFLQGIEQSMGRKRTVKMGPRIIDLDILLYGNEVIEEEDLVIPHPRLHERRFVLVPLMELVPDLLHPILKKTVTDLLKEREDGSVELYAPPPREVCQ
ncbi:MAG: 2-amino-4-hydroxy-6-hydroxymethyldihydropteridine diphosphokinase [Deltaproteobacteria bacterium]|nr:2-amino-4-hydroxy-6-hydroxymethyldihydropteridine diphosphokinase [Deltaproteobacteria bacterium]